MPYGWKRLVPSRLFPLCACDVDVLEAWTERKRCVNLIYFFVLLSHVWLYDFACVMKHVTDPAMYINRTCRQFLAVILIVQDNRYAWTILFTFLQLVPFIQCMLFLYLGPATGYDEHRFESYFTSYSDLYYNRRFYFAFQSTYFSFYWLQA